MEPDLFSFWCHNVLFIESTKHLHHLIYQQTTHNLILVEKVHNLSDFALISQMSRFITVILFFILTEHLSILLQPLTIFQLTLRFGLNKGEILSTCLILLVPLAQAYWWQSWEETANAVWWSDPYCHQDHPKSSLCLQVSLICSASECTKTKLVSSLLETFMSLRQGSQRFGCLLHLTLL